MTEIERKHPLAMCENCTYGDQGGFVPTLNPTPSSGIAVVGEAPGAYEAAYGIPFTGPSGDLLNTVLEHHKIERSEIMITNTVLCRPEANQDPTKAAVAACAPRLAAELARGGVRQILAVGKSAAHALLDDNKASMKSLRIGPSKPYKNDSRVSVIATWHPAFCLRSPDAFPDFVSDVGKLHGVVTHDWVEPDFRVFDDPASAHRALAQLERRYDRFVIDIESGVEKDTSFVHPSEYPLLCVGLAFESKKVVVFGENAVNDPEFKTALWRVLSKSKLTAHNGKFDLAGLRYILGPLKLHFDTMLAAYCLDERPGHMALEGLAVENLGCPNWKYDIKQYIPRSGNYANIPRDVLYHYNAIDCSNTWDLEELFRSKMTRMDFQKHDFLIQAAMALIELELEGLTFDTKYNVELNERFIKELDEIEITMNNIAGHDINPRSVPQVTRYYASQGLILPTTEADFLKELCDSIEGEALEFTQQLLLHRRRAKLYGTYVKGLANRVSHGKVFTTYLLHGTTSGRLSSRGPNLQNVVREPYIRNQFTASSPEHVLVQLDYKQAEGRVIATLAKDEYLRNIFADETRDLFSELCNDIFGIGLWNKENRVAMKSIFYGNAYGRGVISIAKELNLQKVAITESEVKTLMKDFNALIPGVMAWQAKVKHQVLSGEDLTTPFGRRRSFWLITDKNRTDVLNEALSFLPQSIASDICVRAMVNVLPQLSGIATVRLTIHDALVFECTKDMVDTATNLVRTAMLDSATEYTTYIPFAVDQSVGFRWGEL